MNYTLESFIEYCDDMMIAEEGVGKWVRNKLKRKPTVVYKLTNKDIGNVYKVNREISVNPSKLAELKNFILEERGTQIDNKTIFVHDSAKSILNKKVYLYTLDAGPVVFNKNRSCVTSSDLMVKNVEVGTIGELLQKNGIKVKSINVNVNERKQIIQTLGNEYIELVKQHGVTKGVELCDYDKYEYDELFENFIH